MANAVVLQDKFFLGFQKRMKSYFPYWEDGGVYYSSQKFSFSPLPRKITPPTSRLPLHQIFVPRRHQSHTPTKQQFSSYIPIKTAFLAVVIAPAPFLFKIPYSLDTQFMLILILIDIQYSQKSLFNFEKDWNHQDHYSSGSLHLVKKVPPVK